MHGRKAWLSKMKELMALIQINHNFRKSVNLQLDLGNYERIGSYIPTRSSLAILERYLESVSGRASENATILIGPYGKGKSHLLLVLLALLGREKSQGEALISKMQAADREMAEQIKKVTAKRCYLPVLVSGNAGENLNQAFIFALREALVREGLEQLSPESYYSEAVKTIENWKVQYPSTYRQLKERLESEGKSVGELTKELEGQKKEALALFRELYPALTAGSSFEPLLQQEAMKVYPQIIRALREEHHYTGIFIVFDEFSKYLEGHDPQTFSRDMKILQEMCELANAGKQGELMLTMVAHKSIREYTKGLDRSAVNAFRGVEGRIREIEFVISAQNNYELVADTIGKKEPEFGRAYEKLEKNEQYRNLMEGALSLPCFHKMFTEDEFRKVLGRGCFPLTPVAAYALLRISEKVAQNERTIFTFLADEGQGSLPWLLKNGQTGMVGVDKIYDYFRALFRENNDLQQIHAEWLVAEYALERVETEEEKRVIKAMAVIRMIHREEELPARKLQIRQGLAMDEELFERTMDSLIQKELIVYRASQGIYGFRKAAGAGLEEAVKKAMAAGREHLAFSASIREVSELEYELPKKYNQEYAITRYFQYEYRTPEEFLQLENTGYLFEESFADGKLILLPWEEKTADKKLLQKKLDGLGDERVLLFLSEQPFLQRENLNRLQAVRSLQKDTSFIDGNEVLLQELHLYEEDLVFEINAAIEENFLAENGNVVIMRAGKEAERGTTRARLNEILSDICYDYYAFSPKVNHELLNIRKVEGQYLRARNAVIKRLLDGEDCTDYLTGSSPESMVYRASFVHTKEDEGVAKVCDIIDTFFREDCAGKKGRFGELYARLLGQGTGTRKGVLPLFLAKKLSLVEGTPVIYLREKEMEMSVETLNNINEFPEKYQLYIEAETVAKNRYLETLEELFCEKGGLALTKKNRIGGVTACMQRWYRSLPQYAAITDSYPEEYQGAVKGIRNLLRRAEVNPHELLFEKIPSVLGTSEYLDTTEKLTAVKNQMDSKLAELSGDIAGRIKKIFGAKENESLQAVLGGWYRRQSGAAKTYILTTTLNRFMGYLENLTTNNEEEIVSDLTKIVMDMYLEDWNDAAVESFEAELRAVKSEVEQISEVKADAQGKNRIILKDAQGNEMERCFEADITDSTSNYLKNAIEDALEEFGDTLEMNQKVAVLVQTLEHLLQ